MRGKYSPTVTAAYMRDQKWWYKYSGADLPSETYVQYDPEGFDSYGYNKDDVDRAGNHEYVYMMNDAPLDSDDDYNWAYDSALDDWGFDGTKPFRR